MIGSGSVPNYDRGAWNHWVDADNDCQNTRAEVLIAQSLAPVTFTTSSNCTVLSGRWYDPYTNAYFTIAHDLDVDHFVPLGNAHSAGGSDWAPERKRDYANSLSDVDHLIAVSLSANRSKGNRAPDEWMPPNRSYWCEYAYDWIRIKTAWGLAATQTEWAALQTMTATCPAGFTYANAAGGAAARPATPGAVEPTATSSIPNLPSLAAPVVSGVGATFASVTLPAKPAGFDNYGNQFYVKLFTAADATSGEIVLGGWVYAATPWGTLQATSNTALQVSTTYWARFWLRDSLGREVLSDATSFTTLAMPALPTLTAPVVSKIGGTFASVTLPANLAGFDNYGNQFYAKLFTAADASSGESVLGGWAYAATPWGTLQATSNTALLPGTTYWARFWLRDNFGRTVLSDAASFTTLGSPLPGVPPLDAPVVTAVLPDNVTVRWPAKPAWFDDATMTEVTLMACPTAEFPCNWLGTP
ncbi:MAG: HNH endonuclease, partial [Chloroflexi bacterium]